MTVGGRDAAISDSDRGPCPAAGAWADAIRYMQCDREHETRLMKSSDRLRASQPAKSNCVCRRLDHNVSQTYRRTIGCDPSEFVSTMDELAP